MSGTERKSNDFPLLIMERDIGDDITPEKAAERVRKILAMGRRLQLILGRAVVDANPSTFNKVH
ncbi:MAG: hypothetical protein COV32_03375 [Candidatus Yonathbacteria bacterium CG10_big_fil_rev_8_21_14_0_10_43_136]|uniref:Uncharacterized protein n=2 Tax=Parcubacteria group TaxID=1794811 RepID=A0A2M7Q450_9BACT|nr:MAG: hypothetical protein AUK15_02195 [Candidatus Nomurabacteria bacterium CG2_30_43_9]PIQ36047.1 MAG: hypothetical protein COW60_00455 [Candidatus Yonathbacteria bacterium CG17_big_fil_post_rev_8_21_14_2_50_43_9]PIR40396.1 MAG: hypothetical protein COV32_03375 [Candidatus Yonathbacteria bacterium CG10_big_fil_rev_8_21_14_0_10_43_136]PIX57493.1 MAG: hypothetical protein COZ48_00240 [Candidatus Yonathbacteria bacterium CG_4_10_14_3_um_filter_43_12]PIY58188.1 MAG: hypothetical protein COY98_03